MKFSFEILKIKKFSLQHLRILKKSFISLPFYAFSANSKKNPKYQREISITFSYIDKISNSCEIFFKKIKNEKIIPSTATYSKEIFYKPTFLRFFSSLKEHLHLR